MGAEPSGKFDPYHEWLGIPPEHRPVSHYRLLGVDPAEKSVNVISSAAMRQATFLRQLQRGEHGEIATQILAEIETARAVLIDPKRRSDYDNESKLRSSIAPDVDDSSSKGKSTLAADRAKLRRPLEEANPIVVASDKQESYQVESASRSRERSRASSQRTVREESPRRRTKARRSLPLGGVIGLCAVVGIAIGFLVLRTSRSTKEPSALNSVRENSAPNAKSDAPVPQSSPVAATDTKSTVGSKDDKDRDVQTKPPAPKPNADSANKVAGNPADHGSTSKPQPDVPDPGKKIEKAVPPRDVNALAQIIRATTFEFGQEIVLHKPKPTEKEKWIDAALQTLKELEGSREEAKAEIVAIAYLCAACQPKYRKEEVLAAVETFVDKYSGDGFSVEAFARWDPREEFTHLESLYQRSKHPGLLREMGHTGDKRAIPILVAAMARKNLRFDASSGLQMLGDMAEDPLLKAMKAGDKEYQVAVHDILKNIGGPKSIAKLEPLTNTNDRTKPHSVARSAEGAIAAIEARLTQEGEAKRKFKRMVWFTEKEEP